MGKKLFGNKGRHTNGKRKSVPAQQSQSESETQRPKKKKSKLRIVVVILAIILLLECLYCVAIFTDIPPFASLRRIYIDTAWGTMNHRWLATAFIPGDIVQGVVDEIEAEKAAQSGIVSQWGDAENTEPEETRSASVGFSIDQAASILSELAHSNGMAGDMHDFFALYHELDQESVEAYVQEHPEAIADGWDNFYVNEAGLDDEGTEIYTNQGDQVLAINAEHGLMAIRITGSGYQGVMVIGKDPSRLTMAYSEGIGSYGQYVGAIAENNRGIAAMTASGFDDTGGGYTEGAVVTGGSMAKGVPCGVHYPWGFKRVELHLDNRLYITDSYVDYSENCTDACEFSPALIIDGEIVVNASDGYTSLNPRACLGQTTDESILFLVIEGRLMDSLGTDVEECANILKRYDCYQAMNVDGGSSAIIWYEGEYITRCSNKNTSGRQLPNAWVYCSETVPDPE